MTQLNNPPWADWQSCASSVDAVHLHPSDMPSAPMMWRGLGLELAGARSLGEARVLSHTGLVGVTWEANGDLYAVVVTERSSDVNPIAVLRTGWQGPIQLMLGQLHEHGVSWCPTKSGASRIEDNEVAQFVLARVRAEGPATNTTAVHVGSMLMPLLTPAANDTSFSLTTAGSARLQMVGPVLVGCGIPAWRMNPRPSQPDAVTLLVEQPGSSPCTKGWFFHPGLAEEELALYQGLRATGSPIEVALDAAQLLLARSS